MKFKVGDVIICSGFDDMPRPRQYNQLNIIEYFGGHRDDLFVVNDILCDDEIVVRLIGGNMEFATNPVRWCGISYIRNKKLEELGIK